ncbi:metallopeptidase family protein [Brachybacterium sp. EF45031]|uniref:metallopeptidase family protein n=1 Tax=Brachybacterium sillae TaxID=2810536 RepID=UPI00217D6015|nr:metallopeptidase family protein [Brachybacterium sillae]MCS6712213.1 metallopeptidase family protein [Brachybacterium sillae]
MVRMSRREFEDAVDDALDSLPDEVARAVAEANVAILVEEEPPAGEDLLGLYVGIPLDERSVFQGYAEPDRILIFRGPLSRLAVDREHLVHEIRVTVLHEIGHLFGIDDARLHELGWG